MTILEFLNRTVAFLGSILPYLFGTVVVFATWGYMSAEDYDSDYVTFTVSCATVLGGREPYPDYIVNECMNMRSER